LPTFASTALGTKKGKKEKEEKKGKKYGGKHASGERRERRPFLTLLPISTIQHSLSCLNVITGRLPPDRPVERGRKERKKKKKKKKRGKEKGKEEKGYRP